MTKRIFPVIKINNRSDREIGNLIFTYENCKYPGGVKRVKGHDVKTVDIPNKHIDYTTELLMVHRDKNGNKQKYMIEKDFNNEYDKEINLNIFAVSDMGEIDFSIE
ncbi:hypothetical protein [uncultured Clostridium sp.]|uniref:hypothetical protein n=1 Tax=uncultured Clostridium sp. TaxID=59620 RepID=UPI0026242BD4|nr:hypothetical protein [uncultured Clostridium sp.]